MANHAVSVFASRYALALVCGRPDPHKSFDQLVEN